MNYCTTCREDFATVPSFDAHRVGDHGPGEYKGPIEDWQPNLGRRCLDVEEMEARGFRRDRHGRWLALNMPAREKLNPIMQRVSL